MINTLENYIINLKYPTIFLFKLLKYNIDDITSSYIIRIFLKHHYNYACQNNIASIFLNDDYPHTINIFIDFYSLMKQKTILLMVIHKWVEQYENKDFLVFSMGIFKKKYAYEIPPNRKVVNLPLDKKIEDFILSVALPWNVCRPIFKMSLIQNKIGFNEKIHNFQDDEFHIRLLSELKPDYLSIDITDCYYRYDEVSLNKYESLSGYQNIVNCQNDLYLCQNHSIN